MVGACYPESAELDYLRAKVDAGVSVLVTQLFFDNADYFRFVERVRAAGIDVPVLPGIIPIASAAQAQRLASMCGASVPDGLRRELEQRAHDPAAAAQLGIAYATAQCAELLDAGVAGAALLHLQPLAGHAVDRRRAARPGPLGLRGCPALTSRSPSRWSRRREPRCARRAGARWSRRPRPPRPTS